VSDQLDLPSLRSLERALHGWSFRKNERIGLEDKQLVQRLWVVFYDMGLNDKEIIRFLVLEAYNMSLRM